MRSLLIGAVVLLVLAGPAAPLVAHPGVSVVMDSRGNVFYTDLHHVWRIAPDGSLSIAVRNVHTHELALDAADNLYGEHLWYEGEASDTWGHRVWRRSPDGTLTDVIPAREGFLANYSFVRDRIGTMYWAEGDPRRTIHKRTPDGRIALHATADFRDIRWMTATPDGTLYLVDDGALRRVDPDGTVHTMARGLRATSWTNPFGWFASRHNLMGLWTDRRGNVYVAAYGARHVKRFGPDGEERIAARSRGPWSPTGGMVAPDGALWLLEYSMRNAVRVRRIDREGRVTTYQAGD